MGKYPPPSDSLTNPCSFARAMVTETHWSHLPLIIPFEGGLIDKGILDYLWYLMSNIFIGRF